MRQDQVHDQWTRPMGPLAQVAHAMGPQRIYILVFSWSTATLQRIHSRYLYWPMGPTPTFACALEFLKGLLGVASVPPDA